MKSISVRSSRPVAEVEGTALYECVDGAMPVPGPRVAIVGLMHGNEPVGGAVLNELEACIGDHLSCGSVLTVRANLRAAALNVRHLEDGVDMNRQWDADTLARLTASAEEDLCYEELRARQLAPLLLGCDLILDIHSTSRPSPACLLIRDDQRHAEMALNFGVKYIITGLHEGGILDGGMCSNTGMRAGEYSERVGFTFEAGEHTDPGNTERGWTLVQRVLGLMGMWSPRLEESNVQPEVYEVMERFRQSPAETTPYRFVGYKGGEPGSPRRGAARSLASFETIEAGEVILRRGTSGEFRAQGPFTILMPAPTAAPGTDLFYFTQRRHGGLAFGQTRTTVEAKSEATAVERMIDLLNDDDFERGCTWVSFESRRALDMCADMIGRASRMQADNPHRRILVVGRGDWAFDESERRAGQRYRQAMRRAVGERIPIERVQLFRGASLGWLDLLSTGSAAQMVAEGGRKRLLKLWLSVKQPHTVSVLVVGDIDLALKSGNLREIRVAIVIEAATVEPDGVSSRVRVARCGMFSSRPQFLASVAQLLSSLRAEHHMLMRQPNFRDDPDVQKLLGEDGAIEASTDPVLMKGLRDRLYSMQIDHWITRLRAEVPKPVSFETDEALGVWLTDLIVRTEILDTKALRDLLIRRAGSGWVADCAFLDSRVNPPLEQQMVRSSGRTRIQQPLLATDVHQDNLERWVGWKRYISGAQSIPGERGKDVDVVFKEEEIQGRVARWFRRAIELGKRSPGDVRVVLAGDGMTPTREREGHAWDVVVAHRDLVTDANVGYLRIQHTLGTNFSWMKDICGLLLSRPPGEPAAIQWEEAHGAVVNIVLLCTRVADAAPSGDVWSLEDWNIDACSVLVSDLHAPGVAYKLALFTESIGGAPPSQELTHFGRSHCEGLLRQGGIRALENASRYEFDRAIVPQLERWVRRIIGASYYEDLGAMITEDDRVNWVIGQLGISDTGLAKALVAELDSSESVEVAARRVWEGIRPWPGRLWGGSKEVPRPP